MWTGRFFLGLSLLTIMRVNWINAARLSPSPASRLLQGLNDTRCLVGAGLLAMVVNENACDLDNRGAFEAIASKPAPTGIALPAFPGTGRGPL
ncbi:hypothetical protein CRX42_25725 [Pseudomonas jessenii]|uniref:Uncharacterized protein n=1 Tax=Pseudomonas jessenii TaxID=77298 RepID=A0A2W0EFY5_PSEJE|nr:hypothetical protein CRX42_25725 [Pseudomonas jessenii]